MQEIIFYNGFNLLVDIILCSAVGFFAYRAGMHSGYLKGYGHGQEDYRERSEHEAEYWYNNSREEV